MLNRLIGVIFLFSILAGNLEAIIYVGVGKRDITPPVGTPSAGYAKREGQGMKGIHDPLLSIALMIDTGKKNIVLCSVDNLGFSYEMVKEITLQVQKLPELSNCELFIGSSHTHSGGGAFLNVPELGETLAGPYDLAVVEFYISTIVNSIKEAKNNLQPAKIGFGYGETDYLGLYRSSWPLDVSPSRDLSIIKLTNLSGSPIAVVFNYGLHPTVLEADNWEFSADFVGYARDHIQKIFGENIEAIYFNGAQGDISPNIPKGGNRFEYCNEIGKSLAKSIAEIYKKTSVESEVDILTVKEKYDFIPLPTPFGTKYPIDKYNTEINLLIFNQKHAFVGIPGELSCVYCPIFKAKAKELGIEHLSILGLLNDAHGYIISPGSWEHKTFESRLSFGGEFYGKQIEDKVFHLLETAAK